MDTPPHTPPAESVSFPSPSMTSASEKNAGVLGAFGLGSGVDDNPLWPSYPFPLITTTGHTLHAPDLPANHDAIRVARLMALTHNTIFRALNAIHTQAPAVDPSSARDVADMCSFASFALAFLESHHRCEELVFFPMIEAQAGSPGLMSVDIEEHRMFDGMLRELSAYVKRVRGGEEQFEAGALRGYLEALAGPLGRHMHGEIGRLLVVGERLGAEKISVCYKALHDEAEGTTDPYEIGPLVLGCQDKALLLDGHQIQFPELPFSLVPHLVEHVVSRRHAGAWRFCPSTFHGQLRETEFRSLRGGERSTEARRPKAEGSLRAAVDVCVRRARNRVLADRLVMPLLLVLLLMTAAGWFFWPARW